MTLKSFNVIRLVMIMVLAAIISESVAMRSFVVPVFAMAIAVLVLVFLRGRVKGVIADERDYEIGGKASRWAIQVFSWLAVVAMFVLWSQQERNPSYIVIASTLAYSVCLLLIVYSILFRYYGKISNLRVKWPYVVVGALLFLLFLIAGIRVFSGEDDWSCVNGQWTKHGNPSFAAPTIECRK